MRDRCYRASRISYLASHTLSQEEMMRTKPLHIGLLFLFTVAVVMVGATLQAQSIQFGKITGTIVDSEKQPLPGVQVTITSDALISGKRTTTSTESGSYIFLS